MRRPIIADQGAEIVVGAAVVITGMFLLWDAWDGRGRPRPRWLGPLLWF